MAEGLSEMRSGLRAWLDEARVPDHLATEAVLAANEAATNSIEHAYGGKGGPLVVSASIEGDELRVNVEDNGSWKDPSGAAGADRGRGFTIMREMMDDVVVRSMSTGTTVQMYRRLERTPS